MEDEVIGSLGGELAALTILLATAVVVIDIVLVFGGQLLREASVHILQRPVVAHLTQAPIDRRVFHRVVRFEEIPRVGGMRRPLRHIDHGEGRIPSDEDGDRPHPAGWAGRTAGVCGDVGGDDDGIPPIPRRGFHPRQGVEECGGPAVAGIDDRGALDVGIGSEQLHQDRLGTLTFVDEGFGADLEPADLGLRIDVVLVEEGMDDREGQGVDVLGVAGDADAGLAEADGVAAGGGGGVVFEGGLRHVRGGSVHLDGHDADVLAIVAAAGVVAVIIGIAIVIARRRGSAGRRAAIGKRERPGDAADRRAGQGAGHRRGAHGQGRAAR